MDVDDVLIGLDTCDPQTSTSNIANKPISRLVLGSHTIFRGGIHILRVGIDNVQECTLYEST